MPATRVLIAPGRYFDCAIVRRDDLTIAGSGPDGATVMTDRTCAGKAILVINANNVTVRNLTLMRARVPDGNGAGIRAEGGNLVVDHVRFINNQDGILAASRRDATLVVRDSMFERNGTCDPRCGHGIDAGRLEGLSVSHSVFRQPRGGDHVYSGALSTKLIGNRFADEGSATGKPLVFVHDSALTLQDNTVVLGARRIGTPRGSACDRPCRQDRGARQPPARAGRLGRAAVAQLDRADGRGPG